MSRLYYVTMNSKLEQPANCSE